MSEAVDLSALKAEILAEIQAEQKPKAIVSVAADTLAQRVLKALIGGDEPPILFGEISTGVYAIGIEREGGSVAFRPCPPYLATLLQEYFGAAQ